MGTYSNRDKPVTSYIPSKCAHANCDSSRIAFPADARCLYCYIHAPEHGFCEQCGGTLPEVPPHPGTAYKDICRECYIDIIYDKGDLLCQGETEEGDELDREPFDEEIE